MSVKLSQEMLGNLERAAQKGIIVARTENNRYLDVSYKGTDGLVSSKWNVKVYSTGTVATTDEGTLLSLCEQSLEAPDSNLKVLQIDDSGWGFPLCGVMVGVSDGKRMMTAVVDVRWFKKGLFETKGYLKEYSKLGHEVMWDIFAATPETHRIEICTGFVNSVLKDDLRRAGFDVRVGEIKGFLQDRLERNFKDYVKRTLKTDMAYDPKEYGKNKGGLARKFEAVMQWGLKNRPEMLKDGWESIQKLQRKRKRAA